MPVNKHALIRYQTLDRCFASRGRQYFLDDLLEACNEALFEYDSNAKGISRRQLFEDIKYMESAQGWSIPLERIKEENNRTWYRYAEPGFSINKQPINVDEAALLKEALLTMGRFKGMPQFQWVNELMVRLEAGFGLRQGAAHVIEFEENPYLKGSEQITPLFHFILGKQVLAVEYQSFKHPAPTSLRFHPYYLKQYNNRWFILGWNELLGRLTNLALDRIQSLRPVQGEFLPNSAIDFSEYFEDVVGVTVPEGSVENVELLVGGSLWPYIETKPLHGSQKVISRDEAGVRVKLQVKLNHELVALILSFGSDVEVLKPPTLRASMADHAKAAQCRYQKSKDHE
ncbi:MAG: WYL domain-containing protein [Flavobacteriales bacterium]|nr:WYL domain-containing protein [Flavobacteriales bacterium]